MDTTGDKNSYPAHIWALRKKSPDEILAALNKERCGFFGIVENYRIYNVSLDHIKDRHLGMMQVWKAGLSSCEQLFLPILELQEFVLMYDGKSKRDFLDEMQQRVEALEEHFGVDDGFMILYFLLSSYFSFEVSSYRLLDSRRARDKNPGDILLWLYDFLRLQEDKGASQVAYSRLSPVEQGIIIQDWNICFVYALRKWIPDEAMEKILKRRSSNSLWSHQSLRDHPSKHIGLVYYLFEKGKNADDIFPDDLAAIVFSNVLICTGVDEGYPQETDVLHRIFTNLIDFIQAKNQHCRYDNIIRELHEGAISC